jgi:hypothetical protein
MVIYADALVIDPSSMQRGPYPTTKRQWMYHSPDAVWVVEGIVVVAATARTP